VNIFISETSSDQLKSVHEPQKTAEDQSILVQSGLLHDPNLEGPVTVPVHDSWSQKTGLDQTFKH